MILLEAIAEAIIDKIPHTTIIPQPLVDSRLEIKYDINSMYEHVDTFLHIRDIFLHIRYWNKLNSITITLQEHTINGTKSHYSPYIIVAQNIIEKVIQEIKEGIRKLTETQDIDKL